MSQPVQPPETPAIVRYVSSEESSNSELLSQVLSSSQPSQTPSKGIRATPDSPTSFSPESSFLQTEANAALLGSPISRDYSSLAEGIETFTTQGEDKSNLPEISPYPSSPESEVKPSLIDFGNSYYHSIVIYERGGEVREFKLPYSQPNKPTWSEPELAQTNESEESVPPQEPTSAPVNESEESVPPQEPTPAPVNESEESVPQQEPTSPPGTDQQTSPFDGGGVIELSADSQEYDEQRQIVTAEGNVVLRFRDAVLDADRLQVNLPNRIIVAEGNVALTRGGQVLRGERFEYYFVQDSGVVLSARGEGGKTTPDDGTGTGLERPVSDRARSNQPLQGVTNLGGYSFAVGASLDVDQGTGALNPSLGGLDSGGNITRFRYEADRVEFEGQEVVATNVRITNDPFSPPELELRAEQATFRRISPLVDEVVARKPRLVFDQGFSLPVLRNRVVIDRRPRSPGLVSFGFDDDDRGGLFIERDFELINNPKWRLRLTPQYFVQKAILGDNEDGDDSGGGIINPSSFGLKAKLEGSIGPRTSLRGSAVFTSLDLGEAEDELRTSLRLRQIIGTTLPHNLSLEYSYRDRLFNGSLGFQTVQSSLGAVLTSPVIPLGKTGISLTYQAGAANINARTDRLDLLPPQPRDNNRINLTRYQGIASLGRYFTLWQGEALPATATEGLRYTPTPVTPYLGLVTGITGVASAYSSGDTQESLSATIGLVGQLGHFSRRYLDYTGFNINYTQVVRGDLSPFLFDRAADSQVLSGGITQQIYGPFRAGFQTSFNLDSGEEISTDLFVEYSRRTYNILLRYNPVQQIGSVSLRINDFNWTGDTELFGGSGVRPVVQGVTRE
ncbi:MAG: DUF3769 domain-containing protein [Coleofasciculaceae cyanobacterium]